MKAATSELRELATDWLRAGFARDTEFLRRHSFSADPAVTHTIATVPGGSLALGPFLDHLDEAPPRELVHSDPRGFVHGDVAWLVDECTADMLWDGLVDMRFTIVFVRMDGIWKAVQAHLSEAVVRELDEPAGR